MIKSFLAYFILSCDFETGYIPKLSTNVFEPPKTFEYRCSQNSFYLSLNPRIEFKGAYADIGFTYYATNESKKVSFAPYQWKASGELGYSFNNITIGYNHMCHHSISPIMSYDIPDKHIDGAYDRIFLRVNIFNCD
jgi:hypothetical protein